MGTGRDGTIIDGSKTGLVVWFGVFFFVLLCFVLSSALTLTGQTRRLKSNQTKISAGWVKSL